MFNFAPGVKVPFPEQIEEKFQMREHSVQFNISFEKLDSFVRAFIALIKEPCFFILHVPVSEVEDAKLRKIPSEPFHENVYYMDGLSKVDLISILDQFGDLFFQDGIIKFGVASHVTSDELFVEKYKILNIWSQDVRYYLPLLDEFQIFETEKLITAWNTFKVDNPGECHRITIEGKSVYDARDALLQKGMYFAKIVDD